MRVILLVAIVLIMAMPAIAAAQDDDALAELARKAQDPLGDVRAIMTDNTIAFDGGPDDDTSYGFQIQPVYAIQSESKWNMIARGILPIMGFEPGVVIPPIGHEPRPDDGSTWGLGDSMFQFFFSPKSDGNVKWGIGPQVSLKTRSSDRRSGLGRGRGCSGLWWRGRLGAGRHRHAALGRGRLQCWHGAADRDVQLPELSRHVYRLQQRDHD